MVWPKIVCRSARWSRPPCPYRPAQNRIPLQPVDSYSEAMAYNIKGVDPEHNRVLAEIEQKSGPNNFLRVMAHRPEAMQDFSRFYGALMGPAALIDRRLREMVYLAVSFVNECSYCTEHHTKTAQAAGLSGGEIREIEVENNQ